MRHLVVSSTELEAEYREQVLPLEKHTTFQAIAKVDGVMKWCLLNNIVDP
jgi:hypothetical protein